MESCSCESRTLPSQSTYFLNFTRIYFTLVIKAPSWSPASSDGQIGSHMSHSRPSTETLNAELLFQYRAYKLQVNECRHHVVQREWELIQLPINCVAGRTRRTDLLPLGSDDPSWTQACLHWLHCLRTAWMMQPVRRTRRREDNCVCMCVCLYLCVCVRVRTLFDTNQYSHISHKRK